MEQYSRASGTYALSHAYTGNVVRKPSEIESWNPSARNFAFVKGMRPEWDLPNQMEIVDGKRLYFGRMVNYVKSCNVDKLYETCISARLNGTLSDEVCGVESGKSDNGNGNGETVKFLVWVRANSSSAKNIADELSALYPLENPWTFQPHSNPPVDFKKEEIEGLVEAYSTIMGTALYHNLKPSRMWNVLEDGFHRMFRLLKLKKPLLKDIKPVIPKEDFGKYAMNNIMICMNIKVQVAYNLMRTCANREYAMAPYYRAFHAAYLRDDKSPFDKFSYLRDKTRVKFEAALYDMITRVRVITDIKLMWKCMQNGDLTVLDLHGYVGGQASSHVKTRIDLLNRKRHTGRLQIITGRGNNSGPNGPVLVKEVTQFMTNKRYAYIMTHRGGCVEIEMQHGQIKKDRWINQDSWIKKN
jgi:hypothetical protein